MSWLKTLMDSLYQLLRHIASTMAHNVFRAEWIKGFFEMDRLTLYQILETLSIINQLIRSFIRASKFGCCLPRLELQNNSPFHNRSLNPFLKNLKNPDINSFQGRGDWNECNAGERFLCQQAFSRMSIIIDGKTKHIDVPTGCSCLKS